MSLLDFTLPTWMADALCAVERHDPEIFFPHSGQNGANQTRHVRAVCRRCPVVGECLKYALDNQIEHGIWGGVTDIMRRRSRGRTRATTTPKVCTRCAGPVADRRHGFCSDECRKAHHRDYQRAYQRRNRRAS